MNTATPRRGGERDDNIVEKEESGEYILVFLFPIS